MRKKISVISLLAFLLTSCSSNEWQCPLREGEGCKPIKEMDKVTYDKL